MTAGAQPDLEGQTGAGDTTSTAKAWSLFRLDARSNSIILEGLTLEQIRQLYVEGAGGQPMNAGNKPYRVFSLADSEVLLGSDYDSGLIKVVAAEYHAVASVPAGDPERS